MFHTLAIAALSLGLGAGLALAQDLSADVIGNDGATIGSIAATGGPHGVVLRVEFQEGALTPGWHGIHVHAVGDCSDHAEFMHSGGHVNPGEVEHGFLNPAGPHPSDLPNVFAHADGSAAAEILVFGVSLSGGEVELLDADGSAVVVHASPDDHLTQPIGGAGARVGCAVLQ